MTALSAAQAATTALNQSGADQSSPIDPFVAIERLGLRLFFQPLRDLLGVILPGPPAGVMINSARPAALQRYTAAHELGHWYLDQDALALDTETTIVGNASGARELDAQTFAAHFLMPLPLVHQTAHRYGLVKGGSASPKTIYQMARDMHVSYQAAAYHLVNCHFITRSNRDAALKVQPAAVKRELVRGLPLADARGDAWPIDGTHDTVEVQVFAGDTLAVSLTETPSTGYRWVEDPGQPPPVRQLHAAPLPFPDNDPFAGTPSHSAQVLQLPARDPHTDVLVPLGDAAEPTVSAGRVGNNATRVFGYGAHTPGEERVQLRHIRPFSDGPAVGTFDLHAVVRGAPDVEFRCRLLAEFAREETNPDEQPD